jgi:hypothetical protein
MPAVHDCAVPFDAPKPQKNWDGQGLLVLDPVGQKKPYGHCTIVAGVVPLPPHTEPGGHD